MRMSRFGSGSIRRLRSNNMLRKYRAQSLTGRHLMLVLGSLAWQVFAQLDLFCSEPERQPLRRACSVLARIDASFRGLQTVYRAIFTVHALTRGSSYTTTSARDAAEALEVPKTSLVSAQMTQARIFVFDAGATTPCGKTRCRKHRLTKKPSNTIARSWPKRRIRRGHLPCGNGALQISWILHAISLVPIPG